VGEALVVSLVGGILGWVIGTGTAMLLRPSLSDLAAPVMLDPWLALGAVGGTLLVGLGGSLYPARRAARLDPTTALRSL